MNVFNNWLQSIVIAVIISTIIEMIIPNGNNKKYVKTVIGIYILFNILTPMISSFSKKEFNLKDIINLENTSEKVNVLDTSNEVKELYIENIKSDIRSKAEQKGFLIHSLDITMTNEKEYNLGSINMEITKTDVKNSSNKIHINEVLIGNSANKEKDKEFTISKQEIEDLKKYFSSNYGVNEEKIYIKEYRK